MPKIPHTGRGPGRAAGFERRTLGMGNRGAMHAVEGRPDVADVNGLQPVDNVDHAPHRAFLAAVDNV